MVHLSKWAIPVLMFVLVGGSIAQKSAQKLYNQGLKQSGRDYKKAIGSFMEATKLDPTLQVAYLKAARLLLQRGSTEQATKILKKGLKHVPDSHDLNYLMGRAIMDNMNTYLEAEIYLKKAVETAPKASRHSATFHLGLLYQKMGDMGRARASWLESVSMRRDDNLRLSALTLVPFVYDSEEEIDEWRGRLVREVDELVAGPPLQLENTLFLNNHPYYYLGYQGKNDRDVIGKLGKIVQAGAPELSYIAPHVASNTPSSKLRVGFVSAFFKSHSVGKLLLPVIKLLPRTHIEVVVVSIGTAPAEGNDPINQLIREAADEYNYVHVRGLDQAHHDLGALRLSIAVFTDFGMEPLSYPLAFGRYAPVQCAMHGHASTTGIPTIDYFISFEYFKEPDAASHYTEKLAVLPGATPLPLAYAMAVQDAPRRPITRKHAMTLRPELGLNSAQNVYLVAQTSMKIHPTMDAAFKTILDEDPNAVLVVKIAFFFRRRYVEARLRRSLGDEHLRRVKFIGWGSTETYWKLLQCADVVLDTYPFGGHGTSLDSWKANGPMVTLPSALMPGRSTLGFYEKMGYTDLVADSMEEYARIALRLGTQESFNARARKQIAKKSRAIFNDDRVIASFELFFRGAAEGAPPFIQEGSEVHTEL